MDKLTRRQVLRGSLLVVGGVALTRAPLRVAAAHEGAEPSADGGLLAVARVGDRLIALGHRDGHQELVELDVTERQVTIGRRRDLDPGADEFVAVNLAAGVTEPLLTGAGILAREEIVRDHRRDDLRPDDLEELVREPDGPYAADGVQAVVELRYGPGTRGVDGAAPMRGVGFDHGVAAAAAEGAGVRWFAIQHGPGFEADHLRSLTVYRVRDDADQGPDDADERSDDASLVLSEIDPLRVALLGPRDTPLLTVHAADGTLRTWVHRGRWQELPPPPDVTVRTVQWDGTRASALVSDGEDMEVLVLAGNEWRPQRRTASDRPVLDALPIAAGDGWLVAREGDLIVETAA